MEASRGKGLSNRGSAASKAAAVGKENICPALTSRTHLSASRSPLPEGFPREPLQDITHILSPINILPNDDDGDVTELGQCRRGHKRYKCVVESQTSRCITRSECELISSESWRGLRKCATLEAASSDVRFPRESKLTEGVENQILAHLTDVHVKGEAKFSKGFDNQNSAHLTENNEPTDDAKLLVSVEIEEARLCRERVDTEVLKTEAVGASCLNKSPETKLKRSASRLGTSLPAARASLRSSQEKQKMSSLMKFR